MERRSADCDQARSVIAVAATAITAVAALGGCGSPTTPAPRPAAGVSPVTTGEACRGNASMNDEGELIVTATWRGQPVKVLIDTGANSGTIAKPLVDKYHLAVTGKGMAASAAGVFVPVDMHDVGPITVGGAEVAGNGFMSHAADHGHYDFALGMPQLIGFALVLDLKNRAFCLARSPHGLATEPMRLVGDAHSVIVTARFGDRELHDMMIDTGAGISVLREDHVATVTHTRQPEDVDGMDATGHPIKRPLIVVPQMCVGGTCLEDQPLMSAPDWSKLVGFPLDGLVGVPFFRERRLVLDFPAKKFTIAEPLR